MSALHVSFYISAWWAVGYAVIGLVISIADAVRLVRSGEFRDISTLRVVPVCIVLVVLLAAIWPVVVYQQIDAWRWKPIKSSTYRRYRKAGY